MQIAYTTSWHHDLLQTCIFKWMRYLLRLVSYWPWLNIAAIYMQWTWIWNFQIKHHQSLILVNKWEYIYIWLIDWLIDWYLMYTHKYFMLIWDGNKSNNTSKLFRDEEGIGQWLYIINWYRFGEELKIQAFVSTTSGLIFFRNLQIKVFNVKAAKHYPLCSTVRLYILDINVIVALLFSYCVQ